jgi:hypothetical protein
MGFLEDSAIKSALNSVYGASGLMSINNYVKNDITITKELYERITSPNFIENVIFHDPATIVYWADGTKTVVKCSNEVFDPEKGLAMAISKKMFGNQGIYYNIFKKWLPIKEAPITDISCPHLELRTYENPDGILRRSGRYPWGTGPTIEINKYGEEYDPQKFYAGKKQRIVCAGDCYHVKNIKAENRLQYDSLADAFNGGCRPCKHCKGIRKDVYFDHQECATCKHKDVYFDQQPCNDCSLAVGTTLTSKNYWMEEAVKMGDEQL